MKQPHGPPMDARQHARAGLQHLIASCLNDLPPQALIDVSSYPAETYVPWFKSRA